ncbi:DUF294 nucleotidyltransferase-like domain-containing protein [Brevibacillus migulae]|uniref:DUF294 nucleotidyltransferase-like domain-containing protein n=1 Tax=Brevibacillus migulae TaxID=1644114 RepID=UPI0014300DFC|nr:DUF294 nucleotidyltransferase-like domain-containing protein [Brevibacillus migulae]
MKAVGPLQSPLIPSHNREQIISQVLTIQELAILHRESFDLPVLAASFAFPGFSDQLNDAHDLFIRRCLELCIEEMNASGYGLPPAPFAFLLFGSGGRREQTLFSDQDNGLLYEIPAQADEQGELQIVGYFARLGQLAVRRLSEVGYPPCIGNVLCSNERWNRPLEGWREMFAEWHSQPTWENIRYLLLAGDARMIIGDPALFASWRASYLQLFVEHPSLISRCVSNTLHHRVPLGFFGRIVTEVNGQYQGAIHIKNGLYLPFVNCIRLWSLAQGISATHSLDRLDALRQQGIWNKELCEEVFQHFQQAVYFRLLAATHWQEDLFESSCYVSISNLSKNEVSALKQAMKQALDLHKMTASFAKGAV